MLVPTLALAALATACGSSHSGSSSAAAQVKQDWTRFFSASTPPSAKLSLLQNGQAFAPVIKAQARSPLASQAQARVSRLRLLGSDRAQVTYTILLAGKPALKNQTGIAVKSGGRWKVSDASFCQLLKLQGGAPPNCATR